MIITSLKVQIANFVVMKWVVFAVVVLTLSWLSASYHKRNGYFFWRTFIMAVIGFAGLGLLFFKLFFVN